MECLDNIIAITNKDCECFPNKPDSASTSDTGLALDELDGLPLDFAAAIAECGDINGIWSKLETAKKTAITQTSTDLLACIAKNNVLELRTYTGFIGGQGFKKNLSISSPWAGLKFVAQDKGSTYIKLNSIALSLTEAGEFTVYIYSNREEEALGSYTFTTVSNRLTTYKLPTPLKLPLFDDGFGPIQYYFIYQPGTAQPKDSNILCGTCGSGKPYVDNFLTAYGVLGTNIDDFDARLADPSSFKTTSSYSYGLSLGLLMDCDQREIICKNYEQDVNFMQYLGQAVLYKAAENIVNFILNSGEISRYTTMNKEHLYGRRNFFRTTYIDHISYLCGAVDLSKTGCFKCKKRINIGRLIS